MMYKSCKYIQNGIAFRHDAVTICNKLSGTKRYEKVVSRTFWDKIFRKV